MLFNIAILLYDGGIKIPTTLHVSWKITGSIKTLEAKGDI